MRPARDPLGRGRCPGGRAARGGLASAPGATGGTYQGARAHARDPGRDCQGRGGQYAARQGESQGILVSIFRRSQPDQVTRPGTGRWPLPSGRCRTRRRRYLAAHARASDHRRHAQQLRGFPVHAGLRSGPHGDPGRLPDCTPQPRLPSHCGQVQESLRTRAPAVRIRHPLRRPRLSHEPGAEPRHWPELRGRLPRRPAELRARVRQWCH